MDPPPLIIKREGFRGDINEQRMSIVSFTDAVSHLF